MMIIRMPPVLSIAVTRIKSSKMLADHIVPWWRIHQEVFLHGAIPSRQKSPLLQTIIIRGAERNDSDTPNNSGLKLWVFVKLYVVFEY